MVKPGGHEGICEAVNGLDAANMDIQYHPDLVTMDITMPEMNDMAALKAILGRDPKARIHDVFRDGPEGYGA